MGHHSTEKDTKDPKKLFASKWQMSPTMSLRTSFLIQREEKGGAKPWGMSSLQEISPAVVRRQRSDAKP